ncbi:hypothetical protein NHX12_001854 [Muraenolepis orangiensis]|uniref:Uncharacterized protein n=1 Tax=Muraenolepis orangiensis TaxID=630683 RepID=A0A9Q0IGX5_9TELE|nr:hypothetical protein NHX12_001854 [Muraenolepis orangiensis]
MPVMEMTRMLVMLEVGRMAVMLEVGRMLVILEVGRMAVMLEVGRMLVMLEVGRMLVMLEVGRMLVMLEVGRMAVMLEVGRMLVMLEVGRMAVMLEVGRMAVMLGVGRMLVMLEVGRMAVMLEVERMAVMLEIGRMLVMLEVGRMAVMLEVGRMLVMLEVGRMLVMLEVGRMAVMLEIERALDDAVDKMILHYADKDGLTPEDRLLDKLQRYEKCCGRLGPDDWKMNLYLIRTLKNQDGCKEKISDWLADNALTIIAMDASIIILQVLQFILAVYLYKAIARRPIKNSKVLIKPEPDQVEPGQNLDEVQDGFYGEENQAYLDTERSGYTGYPEDQNPQRYSEHVQPGQGYNQMY